MSVARGAEYGPQDGRGRAAISATNTNHGRYKNWREKQAKEQFYRREIKRVMREAELAGLRVSK